MKERQFTPFFVSFEEAINDLDDKDMQLSLYRAIVRYGLYGEVPELSGIAATLWRLILPALQSNRKQFINGSSGGAPKGNQNARKTTQKQPNDNPKTSLKDKDKDKNEDENIKKLSNESKESADKPRSVASKRGAFVAPAGGSAPAPRVSESFLKFQQWITANAPRVGEMKEPMTEEQMQRLRDKYSTEQICDVLQAMHNYERLLRENRSSYLTALNWLRRRNPTTNSITNHETRKYNDL